MKNICLIIVLLSINCADCQESNLELIDSKKTTLPAKEINKLLIGDWKFEKLTDKSKTKEITEIIHYINDTITATEVVKRPCIQIHKDGTFEQYDCPAENCETGTWVYDSTEKVIKFKFKAPKYNVPIDRLAPGLLEKLKANGQLTLIEGFEWEISEINNKQMAILEHLPHNEFEFRYNLAIYRRRK